MATMREHRYVTPWGVGVIGTIGDAVVSVTPPIGRADAGSTGLDAGIVDGGTAPAAARRLAGAIARYLAGDLAPIANRAEVASWLTAAGVSGFRHDVSLALFDVPVGVTISYGELAALAGRPGAARAVGTTCARNPLPIVVPCHRVVHAGARRGDVGSYGAATGSDYKRRLLALEDAALVRPSGRVAP